MTDLPKQTKRSQKRSHEELLIDCLNSAISKVAKATPHAVEHGHSISVLELNNLIIQMQDMVKRFTAPVNIEPPIVYGEPKDQELSNVQSN